MRDSRLSKGLVGVAFAAAMMASTCSYAADDGVWVVSKTSGDVWIGAQAHTPVSLKQDDSLKPGDTISTGKNGRALLKRGEETILISPNSVVGLPSEKKDGLSTTILQRAGSILLEVEKRNVKHFEVETPYLAAVVKGTQFQVTVNAGNTKVEVKRGQVEVSDFKSGQIAQVKQGQQATALAAGRGGLTLSGSGALSPIEQGKPRTPSIDRVPVPRAGLTAPRAQAASSVAVRNVQRAVSSEYVSQRNRTVHSPRPGVTRISAPIGEVKLNINQATRGLANNPAGASSNGRGPNRDVSSNSQNANAALGNAGFSGASGAAAASSASAPIASAVGPSEAGRGNGNGNGNRGNGNGNNGANGNGNGNNRYGDKHANGNGNNGNGRNK